MVVEAAPAAAFEMPEPYLLLALLIVALDAPAQLGQLDHAIKTDVLEQGRKPSCSDQIDQGRVIVGLRRGLCDLASQKLRR